MKRFYIMLLPFIYMMLLALFLSFAAMYICDGYYPVGWGWKGASLHIAFWAMPICLVIGSYLTAFGVRQSISIWLLLAGTVPFVIAAIWSECQDAFSTNRHTHTPWPHLPMIAAIATVAAIAVMINQAPRLVDSMAQERPQDGPNAS